MGWGNGKLRATCLELTTRLGMPFPHIHPEIKFLACITNRKPLTKPPEIEVCICHHLPNTNPATSVIIFKSESAGQIISIKEEEIWHADGTKEVRYARKQAIGSCVGVKTY